MAGAAGRRARPRSYRRVRPPPPRRTGPAGSTDGCAGRPAAARRARVELAPHLGDLVAQAGRLLESQLLGRGEHLRLEVDQRLFELLRRAIADRGPRVAGRPAARSSGTVLPEPEQVDDVRHALDDGLRGDPVLGVVGQLDLATPLRLGDRGVHRIGALVGVHDHAPVDVPRRAADRLDERGRPAQEALLVGVEDRHEGHLGQIEPFTQQVDADQDVELTEPQLADDPDALERVDLRVQVPRAQPGLGQILGQVLGHPLGQGRHQRALAARRARGDLADQVVDLVGRGADVDLGIDEARGSDDLLDDVPGHALLERTRGRGHEHDAGHPLQELIELERPVVQRRGNPEPVLDQVELARPVALVHPAQLAHGVVRLVDEAHEVVGEEVDQRVWRGPGCTPVEDPGVVLDARAEPELADHLHVVLGALAQAVGLDDLALRLEQRDLGLELGADLLERTVDDVRRRDVVGRRIDRDVAGRGEHLAGQRVVMGDALDLVAEHGDAVGGLRVGGLNLDRVTAHAEAPALEDRVVALVLHLDQPPEQRIAWGTPRRRSASRPGCGRPRGTRCRRCS